MTQPKIQTPVTLMTQLQPYTTNANELISQAQRAVIDSPEALAKATDFIKICSAQTKKADEIRKGLVDPLNKHVKWINDQFRPVTDALKEAKTIMETKGSAWQRAENARIRQAAEESRRLAEAEALAAAELAEKSGDKEKAEAVLNATIDMPDPEMKAPAARGDITGATGFTQERWTGEVSDVKAICKAIANGDLPIDIVTFSRSAMNKIAADKKVEGVYFGIKIVKEENLRVR